METDPFSPLLTPHSDGTTQLLGAFLQRFNCRCETHTLKKRMPWENKILVCSCHKALQQHTVSNVHQFLDFQQILRVRRISSKIPWGKHTKRCGNPMLSCPVSMIRKVLRVSSYDLRDDPQSIPNNPLHEPSLTHSSP